MPSKNMGLLDDYENPPVGRGLMIGGLLSDLAANFNGQQGAMMPALLERDTAQRQQMAQRTQYNTMLDELIAGDKTGQLAQFAPALRNNPQLGIPLIQKYAEENFKPDEFYGDPRYDGTNHAYLTSKRGNTRTLPGITAPPKLKEGASGRVYNENDPNNIGRVENDPNKAFGVDASGALVPNKPVQSYEIGKARAGASNVSLSTEKGYGEAMATGLAGQDLAALDAARSAPQRIASSHEVLRILDAGNIITGTGAEQRLSIDKALSTAGLVDGDRVKNTENLASLLASQTLDAIKSSGLGSGQGFTDKDRAFLERARAGNLTINAETLRYLATKNEQAGRAAIKAGNTIAARLKSDPKFSGVGNDRSVEEPAPYVRPNPRVQHLLDKYNKQPAGQ